jgi:hypothetical protein
MRSTPRRRRLQELLFSDCATALLTEVFDGVEGQLAMAAEPALTEPEAAWLHDQIGRIAVRFSRRGQQYACDPDEEDANGHTAASR